MIKPWTELTPDERLEIVTQFAIPGFDWTTRVGVVYEYLRLKWLENDLSSDAGQERSRL